MNEDLYNFLLGKIFYFCQLPSYTKWGIWSFEADGKIKGIVTLNKHGKLKMSGY